MLSVVFYMCLCHIVNGTLIRSTSNRSSAEKQCKGRGGLVSYRDVIKNIKLDGDIPYLNGDESVWISEKVKFSSKYVSWHGCYSGYDTRVVKYRYKLPVNNIYNCLQNCSSFTSATAIGLRQSDCYCIMLEQLTYLDIYQDDDCQPQLIEPHFFFDNDDRAGSQNINVYAVFNNSFVRVSANYFGQCVFVRIINDIEYYATKSCIRKTDGYICTNSINNPINDSCVRNYTGSYLNCIVPIPSNWLHAVKKCRNYSGKLISYIFQKTKSFLGANKSYWTGIFRSYEMIIEESTGAQSVCLALTNVGGKLIIHPDNCSVPKLTICADFMPNTTATKPTKSDNTETTTFEKTYHTVTESLFQSTITSDTTSMSFNKEHSNATTGLTGIYVGIAIIFLIALLVLIVCLIRRKKIKSRKQQSTNESNYNIEGATDAGKNKTKSRNAPKTLTPVQRNSETRGQSLPESGLENMQNDCQYDKVNLNSPDKSGNQSNVNLCAYSSAHSADIHVYGHHSCAGDDVTGDYDHLGTLNAKQITKPLAGVYSTMKEIDDTYNVLKSDNTVIPSDSHRDKRQNKLEHNMYAKFAEEDIESNL